MSPENKKELCDCSVESGCRKIGYQYANVSIPVELKPDVLIWEIETDCCGEPVVECKPYKSGSTCEIILTQKICIKIPICYNMRSCIGEAQASCIGDDECCK